MAVNKNSTPTIRTVAPKSPSTSTVTRKMRSDIKNWVKEDKMKKSSKKKDG